MGKKNSKAPTRIPAPKVVGEEQAPGAAPGVIPGDVRAAALDRARGLIAELQQAIYFLENYARENDSALLRLDRAWAGWNLGRDVSVRERAELFAALNDIAPKVQAGEMNADGAALLILSLRGVQAALSRDPDRKRDRWMAAREQLVSLLTQWGRRTRHAAQGGQWSLASRLLHTIWGVSLDSRSLKVEASTAKTNRERLETPEEETLALIKTSPRMLRAPRRKQVRSR